MRRPVGLVAALCCSLIACPDAEQRAERARKQAVEALVRGERDTALDAIASLQRATPDDPESIREQAVLLIHAGEAPRVVWLLEDAVARFPDEPALRLLLAEAALLVNDPVRADAVAAEIAPDAEAAAEALVMRARAAMALGDLEMALARFELAEHSAPERPELRAPRIAALLGERRFDEAAFALETGSGLARARRKLERKRTDYIVLNDETALGADRATVTILGCDGSTIRLVDLPKRAIARAIVRLAHLGSAGD